MGTKVKFILILNLFKEGENKVEKKAMKEAFIRSFLALKKWIALINYQIRMKNNNKQELKIKSRIPNFEKKFLNQNMINIT